MFKWLIRLMCFLFIVFVVRGVITSFGNNNIGNSVTQLSQNDDTQHNQQAKTPKPEMKTPKAPTITPQKKANITTQGYETKLRNDPAFDFKKTKEVIPELQWLRIQDNNIYMGFNPVPVDWNSIIRGNALYGNEVIGFGCHVWAINASVAGPQWEPGQSGLVGEVTVRNGRFEE